MFWAAVLRQKVSMQLLLASTDSGLANFWKLRVAAQRKSRSCLVSRLISLDQVNWDSKRIIQLGADRTLTVSIHHRCTGLRPLEALNTTQYTKHQTTIACFSTSYSAFWSGANLNPTFVFLSNIKDLLYFVYQSLRCGWRLNNWQCFVLKDPIICSALIHTHSIRHGHFRP